MNDGNSTLGLESCQSFKVAFVHKGLWSCLSRVCLNQYSIKTNKDCQSLVSKLNKTYQI